MARELGEPIHVIKNRASELWRELMLIGVAAGTITISAATSMLRAGTCSETGAGALA